MKQKPLKNLAASVRQRLLNRIEKTGEDYQYILMRYGLERILYRLSKSEYVNAFVLKGAMVFLVWTGEVYRPSKDADLLAIKSASLEQFKKIFQDLCGLKVAEDGLEFQSESVNVEEIREGESYHGVRITFRANLGTAEIPLQVDIGFGDAITPKPQQVEFPTLLDFPAPRLSVYPKETVVAEKLETMVRRGIASSRMRDYYDIYVLSQEFDFNGQTLAEAVRATCQRRKTPLSADLPTGLSVEFSEDETKQSQWRAFLKRGRLKLNVKELATVVETIRDFLVPVIEAAREGKPFKANWNKGGPWK